jgi:hypothetical protein
MSQIELPVHEGFEQDQRDYWAMREELLKAYPGKWVAVHKGRVVAVGDDPVSISNEALAEDGYAYCNCVGREEEIVFTIRQVQFRYDTSYLPTALPRATVTVSSFDRSHNLVVPDIIPDTGSDLTCLPNPDCQQLDLYRFPYMTGTSRVYGGGSRPATFYRAHVEIDGRSYPAIVLPVAAGERLLGRDVLNQCQVTFDGPARTVTFH